MYSNVHGTMGTLIVLGVHQLTGDTTDAMVVGGVLAFLSHDPIDRLGEKSYGDLATTIRWEAIPLWVFAILAYLSGQWQLYAVGWLAGNGMDLIDKRLYLSMFWPDKFPHLQWFACHRRKPDINFTLNQTRLATVIASVVMIGVTLLW